MKMRGPYLAPHLASPSSDGQWECYRCKVCVPDASKERLIFNMSEFKVWKGLLVKKSSTKQRELILKSVLRELKIQESFLSREGRMGEARGGWGKGIQGKAQNF